MKKAQNFLTTSSHVVGQTPNRMPGVTGSSSTIGIAQKASPSMNQSQVRPVYMQQRPSQQATASAQQQEPTEPIMKVKAILPHLKEALVNLMQVASQNVAVSIAVDDMQKGVDSSSIPSFNKCLEHFYSLCDQLEMQLNLAYQQLSQKLLSSQYAPLMVNVNFKTDPKGSQLYGSYVNTVDLQLNCAKEIHDLLADCCKKLTDHETDHPTL